MQACWCTTPWGRKSDDSLTNQKRESKKGGGGGRTKSSSSLYPTEQNPGIPQFGATPNRSSMSHLDFFQATWVSCWGTGRRRKGEGCSRRDPKLDCGSCDPRIQWVIQIASYLVTEWEGSTMVMGKMVRSSFSYQNSPAHPFGLKTPPDISQGIETQYLMYSMYRKEDEKILIMKPVTPFPSCLLWYVSPSFRLSF